jgi:SP family arabinose:H+ symporter-like MFS transporter
MNKSNLNSTSSPQTRKGYAFFIAFVAATGGFLFGYDLVIVTGANEFLKEQFGLEGWAFGFTTSSAMIGCILGPFLGFKLCDGIGRKNTLILAGILFGVSAVMTAIPKDIVTFNIFRMVGGLGVGLSSLASPMYIAEVAPPRMRGRLGIMYQLAIATGATISAVVAYLLAENLADTVSWRWMFASELVAVVIFIACLVTVPKSPRWLAEKGRFDEAEKVLTSIDGPEFAKIEINEIRESISQEQGSFRELLNFGRQAGMFTCFIQIALVVGCLLALFNNLTGWTAMAYYMPSIFLEAGIETKAESLAWYSGVNLWQIILTIVALCLVDRLGRRPLWLFGSVFMTCTMTVIGLNFMFGWNESFGFLFVMILLCAIPHALALGSIPWFMMSELFATRLRAKAVMITTTVVWCAGFTAGQFMPVLMDKAKEITAEEFAFEATTGNVTNELTSYLAIELAAREERAKAANESAEEEKEEKAAEKLTPEEKKEIAAIELTNKSTNETTNYLGKELSGNVGPAFLVFTVICILALLFGIKLMPETKGRSLEEIARSWKK